MHRAQADALEIMAQAKCRLADEYDAAQQRGEVGQRSGRPKVVPIGNDFPSPTAADLGLTRKQVHEARQLRDAEAASPGVVRRTLDAQLERGQEPSKAAVRGAVAAGVVFPPLVVFEEGERFWLAEGFHRLEAYTVAGFAEVPCIVQPGGLRDAILHSVGANAAHGVRRSNADKRRAALMLLQDDEWGTWSDSEISRRCVVSHTFVGRLREGLTCNVSSEPTPRNYSDRHGNVSQMRTDRIGRKAEPEPSAPAEGEAFAEAPPEAGEAQAEEPAAEPSPELAPVIRLTDALAA